MLSGRRWTPDLLQQSYSTIKKPIQDTLPTLEELLQNPRDPDGNLRSRCAKGLRVKLKSWIADIQRIQSELEDVLEQDLADTENKEERVLKTERIKEVISLHGEFFQGLKPKLGELDVLIDEMQEIMEEEKAVAERKRIRTQELEEAAKKRTQELEDAENRRKERREERKREMALQLSAQKREMDLAKLSHPVAAETLPASSSNCKSGCPCSVKLRKLQLKCFFGDHLR